MTTQIALVLAILAVAVGLFVSERVRMDLVALLVLAALASTGLVSGPEALAGFSNPAVVSVWAMFIISAGLVRTGIANLISRQVLRFGGHTETRLVGVIMLTAGCLSAVMNNVAVAALMLPVTMDIARRTNRAPSRLLMPLAFGSLLGGLTTLIGTPPNLLASDALRSRGLEPFRLFDFTPVGLAVMIAGVAFMTFIGRKILPTRDLTRESGRPAPPDLERFYDLPDRLFALTLPPASGLVGKTLEESRLGAALGINVVAVIRDGQPRLAPLPTTILRAGDRLLVKGDPDRLAELCGQQLLEVEDTSPSIETVMSPEIDFVEIALSSRSTLIGRTLKDLDFRRRYRVRVLAIRREDVPHRAGLADIPLKAGDTLIVQGSKAQIDVLRDDPDFLVSRSEKAEVYRIDKNLMAVRVLDESAVVGKTLAESRLGDALGMTVLGIVRDGATQLMPDPSERLRPGDILLTEGGRDALAIVSDLKPIEDPFARDLARLESETVALVEAVLSPRSTLAGKTLREHQFRARFGLSVLAIARGGRVYHHNLAEMPLRFGDALLLYGPREKLALLAADRDFLLLTEATQEPPRSEKAPYAVLILAAILVSVAIGWLHISIAAVIGAALMVVTGSLTMEEAYGAIEWRAVFLIAGMLPLGAALESTGAATLIAEGVIGSVGQMGPVALIAALFAITSLGAQLIPPAVMVVVMAPIALDTAASLGISPYALMMVVSISAAASFMSPITHPANIMIMGPGGYRFIDYTKVGLPLTLVVLIVVLLVLPVVWPLGGK